MASHFYKRIKKAGTPEEMQLILWRTIMALQAAAADATTPEELCKVANSLRLPAVNTGRYSRIRKR